MSALEEYVEFKADPKFTPSTGTLKADAAIAELEQFLSGGYVNNCFLSPRDGETLFIANKYGIIPTLDGYRIIPIEGCEG